jgi:hypothetical protein
MIDPSLYKEVPGPKDAFEKWVDIEKAWTEHCEPGARIPRWFFRGQPSEHWTLQSTLERAVWAYSHLNEGLPAMPDPKDLESRQRQALGQGLKRRFLGGGEYVSSAELEQGLIRRFQRQCYHYTSDTPSESEVLEWIAPHASSRHTDPDS